MAHAPIKMQQKIQSSTKMRIVPVRVRPGARQPKTSSLMLYSDCGHKNRWMHAQTNVAELKLELGSSDSRSASLLGQPRRRRFDCATLRSGPLFDSARMRGHASIAYMSLN